MTTVRMQLNWEPNGFQAPYFLARRNGYYDDEGLEVQFLEGHGSPYAVEQAVRGRAEIGLAGASAVLTVQSRGADPLAVAAVTQTSPAAVYTLRDVFGERLERPEQLAGSTIAPTATKTRILTAQLLADVGIADEVDLLPVDRYTHHRVEHKLLEGEVDAAVGVVTNGQELQREFDRIADELLIGKELGVYGMTLVTAPSFANDNRETVRGFLCATARGWEAATNDPDAAIEALIDRNATLEGRFEIEQQKFLAAANELQYTGHVAAAGWGNHDRNRWRRLNRALTETDLLEGPTNVDDVFTNDYLDTNTEVIGSYAERIGR